MFLTILSTLAFATEPETNFAVGQTVAAVMGGMGRAYDGGYAEYTLVPASQIIPLHTTLPWELLAAIPETYLTAWGSLFDAMDAILTELHIPDKITVLSKGALL
jgi:NADPH:quinone reductase-like Zn-dependent oxidoreductase